MPFDGSGNYQLPPGVQAVSGDPILSEPYNDLLADLATALSLVILRSGVAAMTGPLLMGGQRIRSVGNAVADGDAMPRSQVLSAIADAIANKVDRIGNGTGAILFPSGTTAQRPALTANGQVAMRYNTTLGEWEFGTRAADVDTWGPLFRRETSETITTTATPQFDFTVPSWARIIKVHTINAECNQTEMLVRLGNGTPEATGYSSYSNADGAASAGSNVTTGFSARIGGASRPATLTFELTRIASGVWQSTVVGRAADNLVVHGGAYHTSLPSTIDILRVCSNNSGTNWTAGGTIAVRFFP